MQALILIVAISSLVSITLTETVPHSPDEVYVKRVGLGEIGELAQDVKNSVALLKAGLLRKLADKFVSFVTPSVEVSVPIIKEKVVSVDHGNEHSNGYEEHEGYSNDYHPQHGRYLTRVVYPIGYGYKGKHFVKTFSVGAGAGYNFYG